MTRRFGTIKTQLKAKTPASRLQRRKFEDNKIILNNNNNNNNNKRQTTGNETVFYFYIFFESGFRTRNYFLHNLLRKSKHDNTSFVVSSI